MIKLFQAFIQKVSVTMDSKYFITSSLDTTMKITNLVTFQTVYEFKKGIVPEKEHDIALTPDGKSLLASNRGTIKMLILQQRSYSISLLMFTKVPFFIVEALL